MSSVECSVDGCDLFAKCKGMCNKHYLRVYFHGRTNLPPKQTLEDRFWAKVEKTDNCWTWTGSKVWGYGQINIGGRLVRAHRLSYEWAHGPIPDGMMIDHICHNPSCVRPDHLRLATDKQNAENLGVCRSDNKSGFRGVSWSKASNSWRATVTHNGRQYWCGNHATREEAAAAAARKRCELFTHNVLDRKAAR